MTIKISIVKNRFDNKPINHSCTYNEFVTLLTTFIKSNKEDAPSFVAGHFTKDRRITENLESRTLITLDLDKFENNLDSLIGMLKEIQDYRYIAYSTSSHTQYKPRIRIILFVDKEIPTKEYNKVVRNFINTLSNEFQQSLDIEASTTANKVFRLPIIDNQEYKPWFYENAGLDVKIDISDNSYQEQPAETVEQKDMLLHVVNNPIDLGEDNRKSVISWLKKLPVNETDHDMWFKVGRALHHQFSGNEEGLEIWDKWSRKDDRTQNNGQPQYQGIDILRVRYNSIRADSLNPTTFASVIELVKKRELEYNKSNNITLPLCRSKWIDVKNKKLDPKFTKNNFEILLKHYNIELKFNVIKKEIEIYKDNIKSTNINQAINDIELLCTLNDLPYNLVSKTINNLAISNHYNSWKTWICSEKWDGVDRLQDFYNTIEVIPEHEFVKKIYLWKFLLQLIHITCLNENPRPKMAKLVLTLQGKTNAGKTSWIPTLVSDNMFDHVVSGQNFDLSKETDVKKIVEHVIVELGEVGAIYKKVGVDTVKNFISSTEDLLNIKYIERAQKTRRTTVFVATVNEFSFLQDSTGNSRFMCLSVTKCDIYHKVNMQQLYAQVLEYARNNMNESYFLNEKETLIQEKLNETMELKSPVEEKIHDIFDLDSNLREDVMNATNVLLTLGYNQQFIKKSLTNEVSKILDKMNFKRRTKAPTGWYMPPKKIKDYGF